MPRCHKCPHGFLAASSVPAQRPRVRSPCGQKNFFSKWGRPVGGSYGCHGVTRAPMGPWQRRAPRPRGPGFDPHVAKKLFSENRRPINGSDGCLAIERVLTGPRKRRAPRSRVTGFDPCVSQKLPRGPKGGKPVFGGPQPRKPKGQETTEQFLSDPGEPESQPRNMVRFKVRFKVRLVPHRVHPEPRYELGGCGKPPRPTVSVLGVGIPRESCV